MNRSKVWSAKNTFTTSTTDMTKLMSDKEKSVNMHILVPETFRTRLKVHCAEKGISVNKLVLEVVTKYLNN